jgi:anti-sigma factor RsiW
VNLTFQHLTFEKIADMAENRLPEAERAAARAHLSNCSRCSEQLAQVERTINLMRTDESKDAPRDVLASVMNMFRPRAAESRPSLARRVLAALNFDSTTLAPAYGVRSGQATARQMLYSAGEHDVDLRVQPAGESWVVSGQVLGECASGGRVELRDGATTVATAELNELCEFALPAVPSGSYQLRLSLADVEVEIPELQLKA